MAATYPQLQLLPGAPPTRLSIEVALLPEARTWRAPPWALTPVLVWSTRDPGADGGDVYERERGELRTATGATITTDADAAAASAPSRPKGTRVRGPQGLARPFQSVRCRSHACAPAQCVHALLGLRCMHALLGKALRASLARPLSSRTPLWSVCSSPCAVWPVNVALRLVRTDGAPPADGWARGWVPVWATYVLGLRAHGGGDRNTFVAVDGTWGLELAEDDFENLALCIVALDEGAAETGARALVAALPDHVRAQVGVRWGWVGGWVAGAGGGLRVVRTADARGTIGVWQWELRAGAVDAVAAAHTLCLHVRSLLSVTQDVAESLLARRSDPMMPVHQARAAQAAAAAERAGLAMPL